MTATPAALDEWHRYTLPAFLDRLHARLGEGCPPGRHATRPRHDRDQRLTTGEHQGRQENVFRRDLMTSIVTLIPSRLAHRLSTRPRSLIPRHTRCPHGHIGRRAGHRAGPAAMGQRPKDAVVTRSISGHALVHHLREQPRRGDPQRGTQSLGLRAASARPVARSTAERSAARLLVGQRAGRPRRHGQLTLDQHVAQWLGASPAPAPGAGDRWQPTRRDRCPRGGGDSPGCASARVNAQ